MAKWTIANLSDLSAPFLLIDAAMIVYATSAGRYQWGDASAAEDELTRLRIAVAEKRLRDASGLLEGAKVMSVESVYHAMELGRLNV